MRERSEVFVINEHGTCHSVRADHPAVPLAEARQEGWRLATDEEIADTLRAWGQPELIPDYVKGGKNAK